MVPTWLVHRGSSGRLYRSGIKHSLKLSFSRKKSPGVSTPQVHPIMVALGRVWFDQLGAFYYDWRNSRFWMMTDWVLYLLRWSRYSTVVLSLKALVTLKTWHVLPPTTCCFSKISHLFLLSCFRKLTTMSDAGGARSSIWVICFGNGGCQSTWLFCKTGRSGYFPNGMYKSMTLYSSWTKAHLGAPGC